VTLLEMMFIQRSSFRKVIKLLCWNQSRCFVKPAWDLEDINSDIARVVGPFSLGNDETFPNNVGVNSSILQDKQLGKWDVDALNSELEDIVGKFDTDNDASSNSSCADIPTNINLTKKTSQFSCMGDSLKASKIEKVSIGPINVLILRPAATGQSPALLTTQPHGHFINTVEFHANDESITNLMSQLASSEFDGVIIMRQGPMDLYSKAVADLLKIYSRSKPIVIIEGTSTSLAEDNLKWVNYIIRGFDDEGVSISKAMAIVRCLSSRSSA
jgi:hypothetical protein